MRIVVSGNNQVCDAKVEGLGKARITVEFDDKTYEVTNIQFEEEPTIQNSILKTLNLRKNDGDEIRHIKSKEWIKESLFKRFLGKTAQSIRDKALSKTTNAEDCKAAARNIAKLYLKNVAQDASNLYAGSRKYNNFAGKLCMLLKPHVKSGQNEFEKKRLANKSGLYEIEIPTNIYYAKDSDFFKLVREELNAEKNIIQLKSWDELLEFYFGVNFDEANKKDGCYNNKAMLEANCQARADFLKIFSRYGSYMWNPVENSNKNKAEDSIEYDKEGNPIKKQKLEEPLKNRDISQSEITQEVETSVLSVGIKK